MSFPSKAGSFLLDLVDNGTTVTALIPKGLIYTGLQFSRVAADGSSQDIPGAAGTTNPYTKQSADRNFDIACRATGVSIGSRKTIYVPYQAPAAPTISAPTGGDAQAAWTITDPADNGGVAISMRQVYVYDKADDSLVKRISSASSMTISATNLVNGRQYYGRASVSNAIGESPLSSASILVTPSKSSILSAGVRVGIGGGDGTVGANNVTTTRIREKSNVSGQTVSGTLWNGWVDATISNGPQEVAALGLLAARGSVQTKPGGVTASLNQTGATNTELTWTGVKAGLGIFDVNAVSRTYAEFQAAGGSVSSDNKQIFIPEGWGCDWDETAGTSVVAGEPYFLVFEDQKAAPITLTVTTGGTYAAGSAVAFTGAATNGQRYYCTGTGITAPTIGQVSGANIVFNKAVTLTSGQTFTVALRRPNIGVPLRPDLGDAVKASAGSGTLWNQLDWSTASGVLQTAGVLMFSPIEVSVRGTGKCGATDGDSLAYGVGDFAVGTTTLTGDADGCLGYANRALNAAGYSWYRTAVPGTSALTVYKYGGFNVRRRMMRNCSGILSDIGPNNRSLALNGSGENGYLTVQRTYWNNIRSGALPGAKIAAAELPCKTTSTDTWATSGNQTDNAGSEQWTNINPWYRAGNFTPSAGDPDAALPINDYLAANCAAAGLPDYQARKFPCNGTANSGSRDGTHFTQGGYVAIAAGITKPVLLAALGF